MDFRWIIIISSFCVTCCYGDYTCLCNYNVELPIYTSPDMASQVIGYMYEFDCKNLLSESNPEWPSIEFEHQLGFVKTNGQVKIQTCPGSVPTADKIASTTVLTSTVQSSPTTLPLTTTASSTTAVPSTTTSSSKASTSALSTSSSTILSSSTTLSSTTTTSLSTSSYPISTFSLSTFLLSIPTSSPNTNLSMTSTLSSKTILPASSSLPSKTILSTASTLTSSTILYTNSSSILSLTSTSPSKTTLSPASTLPSDTSASTLPSNTSLSSISTLTSKTDFTSPKPILSSFSTPGVVSTSLKSSNHSTAVSTNERSTSPRYTYSSKMYPSTNKSSLRSTAGVNTITIKTTPPPNSASTPSEIITRNSSYLSSKFPMENSSLLSPMPTNQSSTRQTIPSKKSSTTYTPIISFSSSLNSSISSPNAVSQSSTTVNFLSTIVSNPETEKTPIAQSSTIHESAITSTKQASSNFTVISSSSSSSNFLNISTATPSLTPSNYTRSLTTTSVSTPVSIISSSSSSQYGSTEKPIVSDRVDLCPYKNLAMSMYNRTTYTYPLFRQYGNYCYELRLKLGNWFDAQQDCVSRGGELAVIQNKEVQARVFNLTSATKYKVDVWIGLHDLHQEGNWEWVNGAKISKSSFNEGILINPAFTDSQDCVLMDAKSGVWKNTACTSILFDVQSYPWVCQYKMT